MSWTSIEDVERRSQEIAMIDKVLNVQMAIEDSSPIFNAALTPRNKMEDVTEKKANASDS